MVAFGKLLRHVAGTSSNLLFPPVCAGCDRHVSEPGALCGPCWQKVRFIERPFCDVMGTPFTQELGPGFLSAEAIANPPPFARARSAVVYSGIAREAVQALKFADRTDAARWMAKWMVRAGADIVADADIVVPVPLHWTRFLSRRFNQSAELARAIGRETGIAFEPGAVRRVRATRQQVGLLANQRTENVRAAFHVREEAEILVAGRRVLLVDDVYTTGATVFAVTRALKRAGAAAVDVLTFARVLPGDFQPEE